MRTWPALEIAPPDDLVQAALTDFDLAAIDDNAPDTWRVFFHSAEDRNRAAAALRAQYPHLAIATVDVPDEDWAARSQANLKAVRVGNIIVAPPWDRPEVMGTGFSGATVIIIQPSMGFGTGHHATTRLCLAHLQSIDLRGRSLVDVGTGSGVLALAASRLGAAPVLAIDDDPDAIASARENVDLNPGAEITLGVVDLRRAALRPFEIVVANLTGGLLIAASEALQQLTEAGGRTVLSGFMEHEEREILAAFTAPVERRSQEDEWVCVTLRRAR